MVDFHSFSLQLILTLMVEGLPHIVKNSLIVLKNLVSNHLLAGGFVASRLSILVLVLNSMTHQQVKQFRIVFFKAKVSTYGPRDR